jgi:hypothetical protein
LKVACLVLTQHNFDFIPRDLLVSKMLNHGLLDAHAAQISEALDILIQQLGILRTSIPDNVGAINTPLIGYLTGLCLADLARNSSTRSEFVNLVRAWACNPRRIDAIEFLIEDLSIRGSEGQLDCVALLEWINEAGVPVPFDSTASPKQVAIDLETGRFENWANPLCIVAARLFAVFLSVQTTATMTADRRMADRERKLLDTCIDNCRRALALAIDRCHPEQIVVQIVEAAASLAALAGVEDCKTIRYFLSFRSDNGLPTAGWAGYAAAMRLLKSHHGLPELDELLKRLPKLHMWRSAPHARNAVLAILDSLSADARGTAIDRVIRLAGEPESPLHQVILVNIIGGLAEHIGAKQADVALQMLRLTLGSRDHRVQVYSVLSISALLPYLSTTQLYRTISLLADTGPEPAIRLAFQAVLAMLPSLTSEIIKRLENIRTCNNECPFDPFMDLSVADSVETTSAPQDERRQKDLAVLRQLLYRLQNFITIQIQSHSNMPRDFVRCCFECLRQIVAVVPQKSDSVLSMAHSWSATNAMEVRRAAQRTVHAMRTYDTLHEQLDNVENAIHKRDVAGVSALMRSTMLWIMVRGRDMGSGGREWLSEAIQASLGSSEETRIRYGIVALGIAADNGLISPTNSRSVINGICRAMEANPDTYTNGVRTITSIGMNGAPAVAIEAIVEIAIQGYERDNWPAVEYLSIPIIQLSSPVVITKGANWGKLATKLESLLRQDSAEVVFHAVRWMPLLLANDPMLARNVFPMILDWYERDHNREVNDIRRSDSPADLIRCIRLLADQRVAARILEILQLIEDRAANDGYTVDYVERAARESFSDVSPQLAELLLKPNAEHIAIKLCCECGLTCRLRGWSKSGTPLFFGMSDNRRELPFGAAPKRFLESPSETSGSPPSEQVPQVANSQRRGLAACEHKAFKQWETLDAKAVENGQRLTLKDIHTSLAAHAKAHHEYVPSLDTWSRYVRRGQRVFGKSKNSPRAGRPGRNIVGEEGSRVD